MGAHKEYVDAVQTFANGKVAAETAKEAAENKELLAKEVELEKLDAKANTLELEAEKDGASNTTKTGADEARKEYVDAVRKFAMSIDEEDEEGANLLEEDNEAD